MSEQERTEVAPAEAAAAPEVEAAASEVEAANRVADALGDEAPFAPAGGEEAASGGPDAPNRVAAVLDGGEPAEAPAVLRSLERVVEDLRGSGRTPAQLLEALLFSTHMPLTKEEIGESLGWELEVVEHALRTLEEELARRGTPLAIFSRSKEKGPGGRMGYILDVKASYRRSIPTGRPAIPQSLTETLALIALNQPIPQARLVRERGSSVYDHVKELLKKGWIERRKAGRSYELRTTEAFAAEFGLENDPELIKRALARAAGVQGQPEVIASPRVHFDVDGEGGVDLVTEARQFVPSTPELAAPVVGAVVTPGAVEEAIAAVEAAAAAAGPDEDEGDCVVSGGGAEAGEASARADAAAEA
ncbi:MAG: hypothetical protein D6731_14995, partial [Planctomycetota bacterium]